MTTERLLILAAAAGALLAVGSSFSTEPGEVPEDAVALVGQVPVLRADYERALEAVRADRRLGELTEADRARVRQRLIDEVLLVDHGLELGLAHSDPTLRNSLARAAIDAIRAPAEEEPASETELRAFHERNAELFATPRRYVVEHARLPSRDAADAAIASGRLPRTPASLPLPTGELPLSVIEQRLGPATAMAVEGLEPGELAGPFPMRDGLLVVQLVARSGGDGQPFEEVADRVRAEHRRRRGEEAVRDFLAGAREARGVRLR